MDIISLALAQIECLKGMEKLLLRSVLRDEADLQAMPLAGLSEILGRPVRSNEWQPSMMLARAHVQASIATARAWQVCALEQVGYPYLLAQITDPPFLLWFSGKPPEPDTLWCAVVGTRAPTESGRQAAYQLGFQCAAWHIGHLSGLAYGVDAASHGGAVAAGGVSMAVLPGGLDCLAPAGNAHLAQRIVSGGGFLCSEYGPGVKAAPWRFVARNRIIAGFAPVLVLCEAPEKSGALISARFALAENRDVLVHPVALEGSRSAGSREFVAQGARIFGSLGAIASEYGQFDRRVY
jgi:DNA processing protein